MPNEEIKVTQTPNVIEGSLPVIYDMEKDNCYFEHQLARTSLTHPKMSIDLRYVVHSNPEDLDSITGFLSLKTTVEITSKHTKIGCYQIFYECFCRQIKELEIIFRKGNFINYPLNKITYPSFDHFLLELRSLFGPE